MGEVLRVVPQLSESGVDPCNHATPRPVTLNTPSSFSHPPYVPLYRVIASMKVWDCQISAIGRR
jgi:hypothetical protein